MADPGERPEVSVCVPAFNEEANLEELHRRLTAALEGMGVSYELIFVDDGSRDRTFEILTRLHGKDPRVRALRFSRNFGHHIAITAALDAARGETIVLMDADLQDQPEEIPRLHAKLQEGYDVVYGLRKEKKHSLFKRITSFVFFGMIRKLVRGFELNSGVFRIARRPVVEAVRECRERHRLVIGLMSWVGFRQTGLEVVHGERHAGETKYDIGRQLRLAMSTVVAFTDAPLQLVSLLGFGVSAISIALAIWIMARKMIWGLGLIGWPSLMVVILLLGGVQLLAIGVLGEYISRILSESQRRPLYVIATALEAKESSG